MNWFVEFSPLLPLPALIAMACAAGLLVALLLWRRSRGAILRAGCAALLLLALANPSLRNEERDPLTDIAVVVVDESASQDISGRTKLTARIREALKERLGKIPNLELRWVTSPDRGRNADRDRTTLFSDLGKTLADIPSDRLSGVLLVTDGQVHDVPAQATALGIRVPVHALITGQPGEFDRRLQVLKAPRFGLVGGEQTAEVRVTETVESDSPKVVELKILREGEAEETRQVRVGETVRIPIRFPHAGTNIVELQVAAAPGEITLANNKAVLAAEGVRENLRVLLVSGEPHAGERVWRNLLKSDAAVDLVHFTILRPPEKQDGTPINQLSLIAFPTRELFSEKLDDFDLIIFDRYHRRGVLPLFYLDNVARYVESGGAVLVASGERYAEATSLYRTPLSQILPAAPTGRVIEQPFRPATTKLGQKHPVTRALTEGTTPRWGRWFRLIEAASTRGDVLMQGPQEKPLLVLDRRGEGRVALLLSDQAWLWARGFEGGGPYTVLLRRLAHWLMKEPDLEEDILRATGQAGALVIERRSVKDEVEPVEVTLPSGETRSVTLELTAPGIWRKSVPVRAHGVYRLSSGALSTVAHVGILNSKELADLTASDALLKPILEETGGGRFWFDPAKSDDVKLPRIAMLRSGRVMHGTDWIGLKKRDAYVARGVRLIPLFAGLAALALLLSAIALTWFREGR
ncbi:MAG: hypothetical protein ACR2PO_15335 [Methyloligellaceae bacterium]